MKILKISGKNLASLAGEFEVDFLQEPLASSGLFAISGPTGAGKSTLLDALCLALYDATPRLVRAGAKGIGLPDVRDETVTPQDTRNLLRRGTAEGYAEVDFIGNDGLAYRARWSVRRSRTKADGALQNISMSLKQLPELQAIGGTNREVKSEIERRIGLSFEQFTRAVLLAQNEFFAFLKADDGERGELLETLTGTAIYTDISRRAFEREKTERQALQQLQHRLADQKPLDQEARAQLERELAQADEAAAALERRKNLLDAHLRWHQAWEQSRAGEQAARDDLARLNAAQQQAEARRARFARIEAVQAARQPLHDCDRITAELTHTRQAIADNEAELSTIGAALKQADIELSAAQGTLLDAEQSQSAALPALDQAKALDAQIVALMPDLQESNGELEKLRQAESAARQALRTNEEERKLALREQQEALAWLERNGHLQPLAGQWLRWDTLFQQAGRDVREHARLEQILAALRQEETQKKAQADTAALRLAAAQRDLQEAEERRKTCNERLASFDPAALQERKQAAEARRDLLADTERLWRDHASRAALHAEKSARAAQLRDAIAGVEAELRRIGLDMPEASALLAQAERALRIAETASGKNVEELRAALEDGEPCPVCGSHDHPYRVDDPKWHAMLAGLNSEVERCRTRVQALMREQAAQAALAAESRRQSEEIAGQLQALDEALRVSAQAWETHAVAVEAAAIAADARQAWFSGRQQQVRESLQAIAGEEQAVQQAAAQRDKAQQEYDSASQRQAGAREAEIAARAALDAVTAQCVATAAKSSETAERIDAALEELDTAFPDPQWRTSWRAGPDAFHSRCKEDAGQWQARCAARDDCALRIGKLDIARQGLLDALARTAGDLTRAEAAHALRAAALEEKKSARIALFDGKPVEEVESTFRQAVDAAKSMVAIRTEARQQCANKEIRCGEALAQARQRLAAQMQAAAAAEKALSIWIAEFSSRSAVALDVAELRALLAHPAEWIGAERRQLQDLDTALQNAHAVLREREAQRQAIEAQQPTPDTLEAVKEALAELNAEREQASARATALRLSRAHDDGRREKSAAMMGEIAKQEAIARRWAQLSELIGSADGKKFRNYAQQFTLDVLLGYANRHLAELARRYRLERIRDTLALMVVDQDMGEEMRSVHSLSGGESFLVSLALALGLASLSSNRVRVESLFIDEGFGSLDAETLAVAMDALDGLQAMGRKVGVISHVQEMTERIATRILVQRVTGGRSVVEVCAS